MELTRWEYLGLATLGVALLLLVALCSGPGEEKQTFKERCDAFCEHVDSKPAFCDLDHKTVICR